MTVNSIVFLLSRAIINLMTEPEVTEKMARPQVLEGTWEEQKLHELVPLGIVPILFIR